LHLYHTGQLTKTLLNFSQRHRVGGHTRRKIRRVYRSAVIEIDQHPCHPQVIFPLRRVVIVIIEPPSLLLPPLVRNKRLVFVEGTERPLSLTRIPVVYTRYRIILAPRQKLLHGDQSALLGKPLMVIQIGNELWDPSKAGLLLLRSHFSRKRRVLPRFRQLRRLFLRSLRVTVVFLLDLLDLVLSTLFRVIQHLLRLFDEALHILSRILVELSQTGLPVRGGNLVIQRIREVAQGFTCLVELPAHLGHGHHVPPPSQQAVRTDRGTLET
jgi:hypothetical protein